MNSRGLVPLVPAILLLSLTITSCAKSPTAPDRNLVFVRAQADFPEAWSHDGRLIAFRRVYYSNYGPPGIYLISPYGGRPRWIYPATLFWPARLRFSPDDRTLLAIDAFVLLLIDVETGAARQPMYTNGAVVHAEWTQDGRKIFYYRAHYDFEAPPDSSFLHVLDLDMGTDVPLTLDGRYVSLSDMRRGPDGRIAAIEHASPDRIVVVDLTTRHLEIVLDTSPLGLFGNPQWWWRPTRGTLSLLFSANSAIGWAINTDGTNLRRFPTGWHFTCLMSPDGNSFVRGGTDPGTRVGVLNIASVDDISGASYRALTSFSLPAASSPQSAPESATPALTAKDYRDVVVQK